MDSLPRPSPALTPERWRQLEPLVDAALELPPAERDAYLERACAGDAALRAEVAALVAECLRTGTVPALDRPMPEQFGALLAEDPGATLRALAPALAGRYAIERELGRGGMATVYLARDLELGRPVALKLLPAEHTRDGERVRRFRQEAKAASALNHPNILTIHEVGEAGGHHFIATEFVDGESLRDVLERTRRMPADDALRVMSQVASALAVAHAAGIVHRDLKPENIMLRRDGYVKVVDFGIAKLTERAATKDETRARSRSGRPSETRNALINSPAV